MTGRRGITIPEYVAAELERYCEGTGVSVNGLANNILLKWAARRKDARIASQNLGEPVKVAEGPGWEEFTFTPHIDSVQSALPHCQTCGEEMLPAKTSSGNLEYRCLTCREKSDHMKAEISKRIATKKRTAAR